MSAFSQDVAAILGVLGDFAEQVTYNVAGQTPRVISAVVIRGLPDRIHEANRGLVPSKLTMTIANDPVLGVASVDTGVDTVTLFRRLGDATPSTLRVVEVSQQDTAAWELFLE